MILERLYIENYKQLREPIELFPPEGAIGIVGANGAGKSTLFESILWAFFGSRGGGPRFANESIPWSGGSTKDPTTVEVTLATDGGSFTVRRRLKSGSTSAEALDAQDRTVVSGTADVTRWVEENLLRMDRTAFEATFYARQKELRFFAHDEGISRVRKISKLLGISSVETAQSFLREDRNTSAPKRGSSKETHVIIGFLKQTFRITRQDIPYLVAAGNHETPRLRSTTAALEYANLVNAISAHGFEVDYHPEDVDGATVGVTLVPHGAVFGTGAVTPAREADVNILVTHGLVPGLEARQHEMGEANLQPGMLEGGFDYIALGHYHDFHEHKPNAFYAGATERFGFGEVDSRPGFAIVEFDGTGLKERRARRDRGSSDAGPEEDLRPRDGRRGADGGGAGSYLRGRPRRGDRAPQGL